MPRSRSSSESAARQNEFSLKNLALHSPVDFAATYLSNYTSETMEEVRRWVDRVCHEATLDETKPSVKKFNFHRSEDKKYLDCEFKGCRYDDPETARERELRENRENRKQAQLGGEGTE